MDCCEVKPTEKAMDGTGRIVIEGKDLKMEQVETLLVMIKKGIRKGG